MRKNIITAILSLLLLPLTMNAAQPPYSDAFTALAGSVSGEWTDVRMPVTLSLESPKSISISGTATLVRDSSIYISLRMLGFEVVQLSIDGDSIHAVDKFNKRYVAESVPELLKGVELSVGNLQSMLMGRPFKPGTDGFTAEMFPDFNISGAGEEMPEMWVMTGAVHAGDRTAECSWVVDGLIAPVLSGLLVSVPDARREAMVYYSDPKETPAGTLSSECRIKLTAGSREVSASVSWNLDKAKWNTGETPQVRIPRGARRISASQLLGMIERL